MAFTTKRQTRNREPQQTAVSRECKNKARAAFASIVRKGCVTLAIAQALLAALMLLAGGIQMVMPIAEMAGSSHSVMLECVVRIANRLSAIGLGVPSRITSAWGPAPHIVSAVTVSAGAAWFGLQHQQASSCPGCPR